MYTLDSHQYASYVKTMTLWRQFNKYLACHSITQEDKRKDLASQASTDPILLENGSFVTKILFGDKIATVLSWKHCDKQICHQIKTTRKFVTVLPPKIWWLNICHWVNTIFWCQISTTPKFIHENIGVIIFTILSPICYSIFRIFGNKLIGQLIDTVFLVSNFEI